MSDATPFAPPRSQVADVVDPLHEYQPVRVWSATGRIGRLRYMASLFSSYFLMTLLSGLLSGLAAMIDVMELASLGMGLLFIAFFVFMILKGIQRAHDMGWSGWTVLLTFIPFVPFVWFFFPGTRGRNDHGAPPPPNTVGVWILAMIFPVLMLGIITAVAIPAYSAYVQRAKAQQEQVRPQSPSPSETR